MKKLLPILLALGLSVGEYCLFQNRDSLLDFFKHEHISENMEIPITTSDISQNCSATTSTIKLANWNLQIFGDSKASKPEIMNVYVNTLTNYDIAFVQEIRDSDGSSFSNLCSILTNYDNKISSRAGRSSSKEQYGVIYKKSIKAEMKDYNPDAQDRWERPPTAVDFNINGYRLKVYNIHTKPGDVKSELSSLEQIVSTNGNVIILGDLNADGNYYNPIDNTELDGWNWVIGNDEDTTSSETDCAYDRIIMNADAYQEYSTSGVFKAGIIKDISDHYPVWVEIRVNKSQ